MVQESGCTWDASQIGSIVKRHVSTVSMLSTAGGELAFRLPFSEKHSFSALFKEIENQKEQLGIGGYGVSMTTLEEVFLRLAAEGESRAVQPIVHVGKREEKRSTAAFLGANAEENRESSEMSSLLNSNGAAVSVGVHGVEELTAEDREGMEDVDMRSARGSPLGLREGNSAEGKKPAVSRQRGREGKMERSFSRAWVEMLRKRLIFARRDVKVRRACFSMAFFSLSTVHGHVSLSVFFFRSLFPSQLLLRFCSPSICLPSHVCLTRDLSLNPFFLTNFSISSFLFKHPWNNC